MKKRYCCFKIFWMLFIGCCFVIIDYAVSDASCLGDGDGDGIVSNQEVKSGVNQFLGIEQVQECCDEYGDGLVGITDLQRIIYWHVNGCDAKDWYEDDNTPETASIIREGGDPDTENILQKIPGYEISQTHNLHKKDDVDWIKFYAQVLGNKGLYNNTYTINVDNVGNDCDPVIELYGADKKFIKMVDYNPSGDPDSLDFKPSIDGVYYAKIYHSDESEYKAGYENHYKVYLSISFGVLQSALYGQVIPAVNGVVKTDYYGYALIWQGWYLMPHDAGSFHIWVESEAGDRLSPVKYITIGEGTKYRYDINSKTTPCLHKFIK